MIRTNIVNIVGGLGNQLFQYIFGLTLEDVTGTPTKFDISDFRQYNLHDGLAIEKYFEVELPLAPSTLIDQAPWVCRGYLKKRIASRFALLKGLSLPMHTDYTFSLRQSQLYRRIEYFFGYWQSQVYTTKDIARARKVLCFRKEINIAADRAIEQLGIVFENAAALHIRRGDYVAAPRRAPQYVLPISFYIRAMKLMAQKKGISKFYLFSDDIKWVKSNFPIDYNLHFIDSSASHSAAVDMCLMAKFSDMIISNSTFGWWAATLRTNENGLVFYPNPWVKPKFVSDIAQCTKPLKGWHSIRANPNRI
jgi:hypothetical protein